MSDYVYTMYRADKFYGPDRQVLAIDPTSGKVSVAARLAAALADPTATTVGRRIVVTGGGTNGVWALTP